MMASAFGLNFPILFVTAIMIGIMIELISGVSLGSRWIAKRNNNPIGYWFDIISQIALAIIICWAYNA